MYMDMDIAETALRSGCNYLAGQNAVSLDANDFLETTDLLLPKKLSRSWETIFTIIGTPRIKKMMWK